MKSVSLIVALLGALALGACKAPETTSRMDTGGMTYAISATRDFREPSQSLAIVAMKDSLSYGEVLEISATAREVIAAYGN